MNAIEIQGFRVESSIQKFNMNLKNQAVQVRRLVAEQGIQIHRIEVSTAIANECLEVE